VIDDEKTLHGLHMALMMSVVLRDAEKFAALLDPDYRTVNEDGSWMDARTVLAEMRSEKPLELGSSIPPPEEFLIRVIGDTAFVSARQKVPTPERVLDLRYVEVWVRRTGEWKFAHWHATRVTPEGLEREARAKAEVRKQE
jgi:hypothetical protein